MEQFEIQYRQYFEKMFDGLIGGVISGVIFAKDEFGGDDWVGIEVRKGKAVYNVWFGSDEEGNGAGCPHIEKEA